MSDPENFASRWSRLKRDSESSRKKAELCESACPSSAEVTTGEHAAGTFDPTSLPPIDSITAGTDIRAFLESGVPAKLTQAALRRAWVSDPLICDFIGVADNQWDFTDPTTIPGFGPLQESDDKFSLIAQAVGTLGKSPDNLSARLPESAAFAEKVTSAAGDPLREVENMPPEAEAALPTRAVDKAMSNAASENDHLEAPGKHNRSSDSVNPRRGRHTHGGALPR